MKTGLPSRAPHTAHASHRLQPFQHELFIVHDKNTREIHVEISIKRSFSSVARSLTTSNTLQLLSAMGKSSSARTKKPKVSPRDLCGHHFRWGPKMHDRQEPPSQGGASEDGTDMLTRCLALILDQIDYGVLLVATSGTVVYANRTARAELRGPHVLDVSNGSVRLARVKSMEALYETIRAASLHGLRRLVPLADGDRSICVAVVPLFKRQENSVAPILLLFGKQSVCEKLSLHWYGVSHGLTPTERAVLEGLLAGLEPSEIARSHGVLISTVRTQIASLRSKTGTDSIGALLHRLACLPPVVPTMGLEEPGLHAVGS